MRNIKPLLRIILIIFVGFLVCTSIPGGIALLLGFSPPADLLQGSVFKGFLIPGLALALIVGGVSLITLAMLIRKSKFSVLAAAATGIVIMFFEFTEILIIGSPPGIARSLQIIYFGLGTAITILAIASWLTDIIAE
jgi:hypothetical protein